MKKPSARPQIRPSLVRSAQEIRKGIDRLNDRIDDLNNFDLGVVETDANPPEIDALSTSIQRTLDKCFGVGTSEYARYEEAAKLPAQFSVYTSNYPAVSDFRKQIGGRITKSKLLLAEAIRELQEDLGDIDSDGDQLEISDPISDSDKVFVVHGHDEGVKQSVARFIEKLGLEAIVLHEQPNRGRTIISKFRDEASSVGFAVVLMTPDDVGGKNSNELSARARQNVVFELGFFVGALGAHRVSALVRGEVERPSDFDGVTYISLDKSDWQIALAKELRAAGYSIDFNRALA